MVAISEVLANMPHKRNRELNSIYAKAFGRISVVTSVLFLAMSSGSFAADTRCLCRWLVLSHYSALRVRLNNLQRL